MAQPGVVKETGSSKVKILESVRTPMGFFVLTVLIIEGLLFLTLQSKPIPDQTLIICWMLGIIVALVVIVTLLAVLRPEIFTTTQSELGRRYSLLIAAPESLPNLDITVIDWLDKECFVVVRGKKTKVALVASRIGPTVRVELPQSLFTSQAADGPICLELKDAKGNRWRVKPFYLFENLLRLSLLETQEKIISDYSEEQL